MALPKLKECPSKCPTCGQGDLAGGGPLACRYTCGHVVSRGGAASSPRNISGRAWGKKKK